MNCKSFSLYVSSDKKYLQGRDYFSRWKDASAINWKLSRTPLLFCKERIKKCFFDESIIGFFYFLGLIIKKEDESIGKTMESRNTAIISGYCANHYSCILAPVSTACLRIFGDSFSRTIIHERVRRYVVHVLLSENPICHLLKDNGFFWCLPVST